MSLVHIHLESKKRWWFDIARVATICFIAIGAIKDATAAAEWLVRKGMRITVREHRC